MNDRAGQRQIKFKRKGRGGNHRRPPELRNETSSLIAGSAGKQGGGVNGGTVWPYSRGGSLLAWGVKKYSKFTKLENRRQDMTKGDQF